MEKRDRTTSVRKATGAVPKPGTSAVPKAGTSAIPKTGRAAGAAPRKGGAGERMLKTSKPPSKMGKLVKVLLTLIVFLGIPAIVAAGFFVKLKNGRIVWHQLAINLNIMKAPPKAKAAEKDLHPNLIGYRQIIGELAVLKNEMVRIDRIFKEHDATQPWEKEKALQLHADLEKVRAKIGDLNDRLAVGGTWLNEYHAKMGEAEEAFKVFAADDAKKKAAQILSEERELPPDLEEAGKDENVQKFVAASLALERHRYKDVDLKAEEYGDQARDALSVMKQVRAFIGQLPSRDVLEGKVPPPPPAPTAEAPKPEPKPEPAV
ncbi:MAG TPA: hypothetical protein VEJ18_13770, partial [Planctomycetota bacterium]|nr:hypothetical protein [Planctomycetota bacterium]